ncbi:hypothetical protein [Streptomyces aureocirculatus]|uniref:hypothetical protein n=1 Tax=Streptomyces aureocirculatus TaxID=67275 RepID=UPI0004CACC38|nr:hypothetical protein [Streptomyces aureocirculatus]
MTTQLRTYRVWAAFEAPQDAAATEITNVLQDAFVGHEHFTMRIVQIAEPEEDDPPTTVCTWARIDAPASMTWDDIRSPLRELYRSLRHPLVEQSMVIRERPDDVDDIITARELRRGSPDDENKDEPGRDEPALHTLTFYWVSTPAEGQTRESAPKGGTYLATFQARGALEVPAVGDTVTLFSQRVQVIARSFDYEYSDAYVASDGPVCTEGKITVYVETPLPKPFSSRPAKLTMR